MSNFEKALGEINPDQARDSAAAIVDRISLMLADGYHDLTPETRAKYGLLFTVAEAVSERIEACGKKGIIGENAADVMPYGAHLMVAALINCIEDHEFEAQMNALLQ